MVAVVVAVVAADTAVVLLEALLQAGATLEGMASVVWAFKEAVTEADFRVVAVEDVGGVATVVVVVEAVVGIWVAAAGGACMLATLRGTASGKISRITCAPLARCYTLMCCTRLMGAPRAVVWWSIRRPRRRSVPFRSSTTQSSWAA